MAVDSAYVATTVNLALADTVYNLLALVQSASNGNRPTAGISCREFTVQNDPDNASDTQVRVGDGGLSSTSRGYKLGLGEARTYRSQINNVFPGSLNLTTNNTNVKVNVEIARM